MKKYLSISLALILIVSCISVLGSCNAPKHNQDSDNIDDTTNEVSVEITDEVISIATTDEIGESVTNTTGFVTDKAPEVITEVLTDVPVEMPTEAPVEIPTEDVTKVPAEAPTEVTTAEHFEKTTDKIPEETECAHSFDRVEYVYEGVRYFCTACGIRSDMLYICDHYSVEYRRIDGGTVLSCAYCAQTLCSDKTECTSDHVFTTVIDPTFYDIGLESICCDVCGYSEVRVLQPLNTGSYICNLTLQQYADGAAVELGILAKSIYEECISAETTALYAYPYGDLASYKIIRAFVQELVKDESTEYGKARKIYDWILQNISYSQEAELYNVGQTWSTRKAVCSQYVQLMHDMLSAADIMSSYTGGYSSQIPWDQNTFVSLPTIYQHVYDTGHAIVTCYVDGRVLYADPTWGDTLNADKYFDMSDEMLASYFIPVEINLMKIIPDGIDVRNYDAHLRRVGDHILNMSYGEIFDGPSGIGINNLFFSYIFLVNYDAYQNYYLSDTNQYIGSALRNCYVHNANDILWFFLPDGTQQEYGAVLEYASYLNNEYGKSIELPMSEFFEIYDDCVYARISGGYELVSCRSEKQELTIPGSINGLPVLYIGSQAFYGNQSIKKLVIEEGVVQVKTLALSYTGIEELYIPASLENIYPILNSPIRSITVANDSKYFKSVDDVLYTKDGDALIYYPSGKEDKNYSVLDGTRVIRDISYNPYIESLTLPESVERIDTISYLSNLSKLNLPSGLTSISEITFTKLSEIVIPDSVIDLGHSNFAGNAEMRRFVLPKSLVDIGFSSFQICPSLEVIEISDENQNYKTVDGVLFNKEMTSLIIYPTAKKDEAYVVPEGVVEMSNAVFAVNEYLKELTLPSTLKIMPSTAINTTPISKINLNYIEEFNGGTFSGCSNLDLVILSAKVKKLGSQEFFKCNLMLVIENPDLITENETFMHAEGVSIFLDYEEIGEKEQHWMSYVKGVYTRSQWEYVNGIPTIVSAPTE